MEVIEWDGALPIKRPGIYSGIPLHVYHGQNICPGPSVSSSGLRRVLEVNRGSPALFWNEWSGNENREPQEDKPSFVLGRAAHHLLFGQEHFEKYFVVREEENPRWDSWRFVEARNWRDDMNAAGFTCLTNSDLEIIDGMSQRLGRNPYSDLLTGQIEHSILWQDSETGLWLKNRPDAMPTASADGCDLKTAHDISDPACISAVSEHAYHQQAALFRTAMRTVAMLELETFSFFFVQTKRPYPCRVVVLPPKDLDLGELQNRDAMRLIVRCIKDARWPGPGEDQPSETIGLSDYYRKEAERALKFYGDGDQQHI